MINENLEAHVLAGIGLVRGVVEEVRPQVTVERVEAVGLAVGLTGILWSTYEAVKQIRATRGS